MISTSESKIRKEVAIMNFVHFKEITAVTKSKLSI
jgi:hypothetical protein